MGGANVNQQSSMRSVSPMQPMGAMGGGPMSGGPMGGGPRSSMSGGVRGSMGGGGSNSNLYGMGGMGYNAGAQQHVYDPFNNIAGLQNTGSGSNTPNNGRR